MPKTTREIKHCIPGTEGILWDTQWYMKSEVDDKLSSLRESLKKECKFVCLLCKRFVKYEAYGIEKHYENYHPSIKSEHFKFEIINDSEEVIDSVFDGLEDKTQMSSVDKALLVKATDKSEASEILAKPDYNPLPNPECTSCNGDGYNTVGSCVDTYSSKDLCICECHRRL